MIGVDDMNNTDFHKKVLALEHRKYIAALDKFREGKPVSVDALLRTASRFHIVALQLIAQIEKEV